ncbi:MAG: hypothetical protein KGN36_09565 [Acidobacteriota bacterium]|nr:hypothetical protein [Acidobacteriota bacterium]
MMKRGKRGQAKTSSPKGSLNLPDLDQAKHAIGEFITWYCSEPKLSFNKAVVTRYRIHLESRQ